MIILIGNNKLPSFFAFSKCRIEFAFIENDELPTWSLFSFWICIIELHFEFRFAFFRNPVVDCHLFQFFFYELWIHYEYYWILCRVQFLKLNQLDRIKENKRAYKQWDANVPNIFKLTRFYMPLSALKWFLWLVFSSARFMYNWVETFTTQFILLLWVLIMRSDNKTESIACIKNSPGISLE